MTTDPTNGEWARLDESPAASAQMIQWYAPETWRTIRAAVLIETSRRVYNGAGDPEQEFYDRGVSPWLEGLAYEQDHDISAPS